MRRSKFPITAYSRRLFPEGGAQLSLGGVDLARGRVAKQKRAQLVSLIIPRHELLLRVGAFETHSSRLQTEVPDKIQLQVEHLRPEIRDLFVSNPFFTRHVCARDEPLLARIFPMPLAPHAAHAPLPLAR